MPTGWEPGLWDFSKKYCWTTHAENCPLCDSLRGRVYTLDLFVSAGFYPGFHENCDCTLEPMPDDAVMSDRDLLGSSMTTYLGIFEALFSNTWQPYNAFSAIEDYFNSKKDNGFIFDYPNLKSQSWAGSARYRSAHPHIQSKSIFNLLSMFFGRTSPDVRVWHAVKLYESINGSFTSESGLHLRPYFPRPITPHQSYVFYNYTGQLGF